MDRVSGVVQRLVACGMAFGSHPLISILVLSAIAYTIIYTTICGEYRLIDCKRRRWQGRVSVEICVVTTLDTTEATRSQH